MYVRQLLLPLVAGLEAPFVLALRLGGNKQKIDAAGCTLARGKPMLDFVLLYLLFLTRVLSTQGLTSKADLLSHQISVAYRPECSNPNLHT